MANISKPSATIGDALAAKGVDWRTELRAANVDRRQPPRGEERPPPPPSVLPEPAAAVATPPDKPPAPPDRGHVEQPGERRPVPAPGRHPAFKGSGIGLEPRDVEPYMRRRTETPTLSAPVALIRPQLALPPNVSPEALERLKRPSPLGTLLEHTEEQLEPEPAATPEPPPPPPPPPAPPPPAPPPVATAEPEPASDGVGPNTAGQLILDAARFEALGRAFFEQLGVAVAEPKGVAVAVAEAAPRSAPRVGSDGRKYFDEDTQKWAVAEALRGREHADVASDLGVHASTIGNWRKKWAKAVTAKLRREASARAGAAPESRETAVSKAKPERTLVSPPSQPAPAAGMPDPAALVAALGAYVQAVVQATVGASVQAAVAAAVKEELRRRFAGGE